MSFERTYTHRNELLADVEKQLVDFSSITDTITEARGERNFHSRTPPVDLLLESSQFKYIDSLFILRTNDSIRYFTTRSEYTIASFNTPC